MLQKLSIKNYAIIKQVEIEFHKGLNIITGETGAGKSILMGALGLVLGERADAKAIMNGEDKCVIESHFYIKPYQLKSFFTETELDYDDHCIIRREITSNGKSRAFINDTPVNLNQLKDLGTMLIDIVSQHETLALNESGFQLSIVDAIAENEELLSVYKQSFLLFKKTEKHLYELIEKESKSKQDEDYYQFILNELVEAKLQENEQTALEENLNLVVPFFKTINYPLGGIGFIILTYLVIVGSSNAVNLTDGLDGLVIMPVILVGAALGVFAYVTGNAIYAKYLIFPFIPGTGELLIFCGAIGGAGLAFLWFNTHPAQVFMGDVGALALGGALGTVAVIVRQEIVLFIMGGIFVVETLSVMIQVAWFKYTKRKYGEGRRIFRMAPLHHHFELGGWKETQVVVRFWIITIILVLVGLSSLKLR